MSSCLSSGACGFDLEHIVTASGRTTSNSSSPSSTLSESSNSPIAISNRKPRKPRKRLYQTYNEAAALLSMACPNIFGTKHLTKRNNILRKFTKEHGNFLNKPPELILPFPVIENSGFLLRQRTMEKPCLLMEPKVASSCHSAGEIESNYNSVDLCDGYHDDFDTRSMLDEEIEQGIDSIMGDSNSIMDHDESNDSDNTCNGYPMGLGFWGYSELNFGFGMRNGVRELRNADERSWWSFPTVDTVDTPPAAPSKLEKAPMGKKNNKKKRVEELMKSESESESESRQGNSNHEDEGLITRNGSPLLLKLDYTAVLNAWSDKGSPLTEGRDVHATIARIDLFPENGGLSESNVTRSTPKNHRRVPFKKIRYLVKNASVDRRPRSKGRFLTKLNSSICEKET